MEINRKELLEALNAVKPGLASKEVLEQTTSFIFQKKKIYTYNDEIAITTDTPLDITGAIPSKELHGILTKKSEEVLNIEVVDNELQIKGKRSKSGIRLDEEITIPIKEIGKPKEWNKIPENFTQALKMCVGSASTDMTKPVLTCIHLFENYVESMDNLRLTRFDLSKTDDDGDLFFPDHILLPASSAAQLINYTPVKYSLTDGWIHFKCGNNVIFSCRIQEGEYPEIEQYIELKKSASLKLPSNLTDIINKAAIFASSDFDSDTQIKVTIKEKKIVIRGEGNTGWFEESAKIKYEGKPVTCYLHPAHLSYIISHLDHCEVNENAMKFIGNDFCHVISIESE